MRDGKRLWSVTEVVLVTAAYVALTRLCLSWFDLSGALPDFLSRDELASKRRSVCDSSEADGQTVKAQPHSSRRTTFVAE